MWSSGPLFESQKAGFSIKHLMKTQMWFLSIAMRRCTGRQLAEQLPIWTPLDWYLYVANHKPSPKSPQIGGINHQNMSGVSLFYQPLYHWSSYFIAFRNPYQLEK